MIYPDFKLASWAHKNVTPFDFALVNPASLDLRLGNDFIRLADNSRFQAEEITLRPGDPHLATTLEYIKMPHNAAGVVYLKSTWARLGLDHALAGFVDCGYEGELTLELHAHRPVTLRAGQRILQLVLYKMLDAPIQTYQGKYQGQKGATPAR